MKRLLILLLFVSSGLAQQSEISHVAGAPTTGDAPIFDGTKFGFAPAASGGLGPTGCLTISVANQTPTGTTVNKLVKIINDPPVAQITGTSDVNLAVGIVKSGAGTTGSAVICLMGTADCVFDNATTAAHYVTASNSVTGDCHDAGATQPTDVVYYGTVKETGVAGTRTIFLNTPDTLSGIKNNINNGHTSKQSAADQVEVSDSTTATTWQTLCGGAKPLVYDTTTNTFSCPTVPLAAGGTNQTAWTAGRCVRVNDAGTALDVSSTDCTGGSSTVGGIIGGVAADSAAIQAFSSAVTPRNGWATSFRLTGPTLCVSAPAQNNSVFQAYGTSDTSATAVAGPGLPTVITNQSASICQGQTLGTFLYSAGMGLSGTAGGAALSGATTAQWSGAIIGGTVQPLAVRIAGTVALSTTIYSSIGQGLIAGATTIDEQLVQLPVPAMDVTSMCVVTTGAQPGTGALVFTQRKGPVGSVIDTAMVITIAAGGGAGRRCYSASTISYAAGDIFSVSIANAATSVSATVDSVYWDTTPTAAGMTALIVFPKASRALTASTTRYTPPFTNSVLVSVESQAWGGMPRAGTMKNKRCYLKTAPAANTVATVYKNGVSQGLTVTFTSGGGSNIVVSDVTHTVVFSLFDSFSQEYIPGAGAVAVVAGCTAEYD